MTASLRESPDARAAVMAADKVHPVPCVFCVFMRVTASSRSCWESKKKSREELLEL